MRATSIDAPPGLLRLPGRGGAAFTLRAHRVPTGWQDSARSGLVLDVGLLDPLRYVQYLARPASPTTLTRLETFLFAAANEQLPEQTLADFHDGQLGLAVSVVQSSTFEVELHVLVVQDPEADLVERDGLNFTTTRAALVAASQRVTTLTDIDNDNDNDISSDVDVEADTAEDTGTDVETDGTN